MVLWHPRCLFLDPDLVVSSPLFLALNKLIMDGLALDGKGHIRLLSPRFRAGDRRSRTDFQALSEAFRDLKENCNGVFWSYGFGLRCGLRPGEPDRRRAPGCAVRSCYAGSGYFAASLSTVVEFLIVAGITSTFSRSAPENEDSLIFLRHSQ